MGASSLLSIKYNGKPSLLLAKVYPDYDWLPWKFAKCPHDFWDDPKNQRKFLEWAGKQLNIKEMNDWCQVSNQVTILVNESQTQFEKVNESQCMKSCENDIVIFFHVLTFLGIYRSWG
jgi:hypothetical protein